MEDEIILALGFIPGDNHKELVNYFCHAESKISQMTAHFQFIRAEYTIHNGLTVYFESRDAKKIELKEIKKEEKKQ